MSLCWHCDISLVSICIMKTAFALTLIAFLGASYVSATCNDQDIRCPTWLSVCGDRFIAQLCPKTCGRCSGGGFAGACGKSSIQSSRVIGGQTAVHGAWPWQVLMRYNGNADCGGTLIAPNWVLTAAHCVVRKYAQAMTITVGEHDAFRREGTEVVHGVSKAIYHHGFNFRTFDNDIALLKLASPVRMNKYVSPACLPSAGAHVPVGTDCYITGWGKIRHPGSMHHILQQARLKVVGNQICHNFNIRFVPYPITRRMVCAGNGGRTSASGCHGDSGGPFVCKTGANGAWVVHGAVSYGSPSCKSSETFTVFARVAELRNWIDYHMSNN